MTQLHPIECRDSSIWKNLLQAGIDNNMCVRCGAIGDAADARAQGGYPTGLVGLRVRPDALDEDARSNLLGA